MIDPTRPDFANTPVSASRPTFDYAPEPGTWAPQVTIVTPFYNTGVVFHETARSVLGQSFQQWEWLIVNDGSDDAAALTVLEMYRACDQRIHVVDLATNQGPGAARNVGYRLARSEFIVQLDSDNLLEPTAIEKWLWFLLSYPEYAFVKGYSVGFGAQEYLWSGGFCGGTDFLSSNQVDATSMVRRAVHEQVGGYDESIREGLEDWEFWLRCANAGFWGDTLPEYLDWYRRRPSHTDRWQTWDNGRAQRAFRDGLRRRYPGLWEGAFPQVRPRPHTPNEPVPDDLSFDNRLRKDRPRLLLIIPWMTMGGADKFNLDLLQQFTRRGWQVTIAATLDGDNGWMPEFARYTPDIFVLGRFLRLVDYPRFLRYLIGSRQVDAVMITHSEFGYQLLPYLRAHCPHTTFVDFCHLEEEEWKNGSYPRMSIAYQELLDLNLVASEHLKGWMVQRGADAGRIRVCYTNVDAAEWCPDPERGRIVRRELGLDVNRPLILYAARICEQKQPRVLAQTLLRLHKRGLDFAAVVAGDGPDLPWLRRFISRNRLGDRMRLLGAVPNRRIRDLMQAADIFFLPSRREGIALSLFEAMACGLTVVGADVGGQAELVSAECGVLAPPAKEETEIRQYEAILADLLADPARRRQTGQAARARVAAHFRLDQMGENVIALLAEAGELHTAQPRLLPGLGLGRASAAQAVEQVRLTRLTEWLWAETAGVLPSPGGRKHPDWRARLYRTLYRWHEPYYHWYTQRGWTWLTPIRERARRLLLRA